MTSRSIDLGALVNAGSVNAGTPLFTVSDLHRIRIYVSVPQNYSAEIRPGLSAILTLPEYPGRVFHATLDSTSDAIGEQSNALLVELLADNTNGLLKPGGYAQVTLDLPNAAHVLLVPASALVFDRRGLQVATVMPNNRVAMKSISLARDMGSIVEVSTGLRRNDRVIDNPPDSLVGGDLVPRKRRLSNETVADFAIQPGNRLPAWRVFSGTRLCRTCDTDTKILQGIGTLDRSDAAGSIAKGILVAPLP